MKILGYYSLKIIFSVLSRLPLSFLFILSNSGFIFVFYILKYRRKVTRQNLLNSFPTKSKQEIDNIEKIYYHHLFDMIVENIWGLNASANQLRERCKFINLEVLDKWYDENKNFIFLLGHTGNWEWSNLSFSTYSKHQLWALYRPLSDELFEYYFKKLRNRFGAKLIPMNNVTRAINEKTDKPYGLAFIADQSPVPQYAYWTTFLNQETAFFNGYDKIARKKNWPVVYAHFKKVNRGKYEIEFEVITENPSALKENELTEIFIRKLEDDIHLSPEYWLWSHRRWKHKRSSNG